MTHYILDAERNVVPAEGGVVEWAQQFEKSDRRVATSKVPGGRVSTVFLGLDHQWGEGPPLVFETMVFPDHDWGERDMARYSTWDEAEAGHWKMVERWKDGVPAVESDNDN